MNARLALALTLVGCATAEPQTELEKELYAAEQAALPQVFTLGVTNVTGGQSTTFSVTGGPPNSAVYVARATPGTIGAGPCFPQLGGGCLDITGAIGILPFTIPTNASGAGSRTVPVPATIPDGLNVAFQGVHLQSGRGSNPVELVTGPPTCTDPFEPNDDAFGALPTLPASATAQRICAAAGATPDVDWFTVNLADGDTITVSISFLHAVNDIDLYLFSAPQPNVQSTWNTAFVVRGFGVTDSETITYTVPAGLGGTYYVAVHDFLFDATVTSDYSLTSSITP